MDDARQRLLNAAAGGVSRGEACGCPDGEPCTLCTNTAEEVLRALVLEMTTTLKEHGGVLTLLEEWGPA